MKGSGLGWAMTAVLLGLLFIGCAKGGWYLH